MTIYRISLSDAQADKLADWLASTTGEIDGRVAEEIREQIPKPVIEEPLEFGSLIRAEAPHHYRALWTPSPTSGDHYWMSEKGYVEVWSELTDVEVLRVGLHDPDPNSYDDGVLEGKREMNTAIHGRVISLLEGTLLKERATAYEHVLKAVEELAP